MRHPCLLLYASPRAVSLAKGERATFVSAKVAKTIRPARRFRQHPVASTPLCFSRQAGWRELAHPVLKHARLAPAWRCDARRRARARDKFHFVGGHPWPSSKRDQAVCFVLHAHPMCAKWGPCAVVRTDRSGPQGGRNGLRPLAAAPWKARRQARPGRTQLSSMDGRKAQHRGGLLFGDFLLATQEKVTRARGRRAERDTDVGLPLYARSVRRMVAA